MNPGRAVRRALGFLVHNWPLKLAAIVLATLLYVGLVASQDSNVYPGPVTVTAEGVPSGTIVTNQLRDVEQIRYIAPADLGRLRADDFQATVDLANIKPDGQPVSVHVTVRAGDPRVTILDYQPRSIQVVLDQVVSRQVPVRVDQGPAPEGIEAGTTTVDPTQVTVSGPSALVKQVAVARVSVSLDAGGINIDRQLQAQPLDGTDEQVRGVTLAPDTVRVIIPLFTNKSSRTLPVNPVITGTPAPGFHVASVEVSPLVVSVEGDAQQLSALTQADTAPVALFGATSDVAQVVNLALPSGVVATGTATVTVRVHIEAVTETRTYAAGLRLDGRNPSLDYDLSLDRVELTLFGSVAELDRLSSAPLVVGVNVAGLGPGTHEVSVVPALPTGVSLADLSPQTVTVTITVPPTPAPAPTPPPSAAPSSLAP